MQHGFIAQPFQRLFAGVWAGILIAAAPAAFADNVDTASLNALTAAQAPAFGNTSSFSDTSNAANAGAGAASQQAAASSDGSAKSIFSGVVGKAGDVVVSALNMIGVRYRWGGDTPDSGLDCSGFVRYVFQDTLGMSLPRRAVEMSHVGEKVRFSDLKPGDLVFFNTMRRAVSHVGIYIGGNKFVHSPSTGSTIRVDDIDNSYWESHFTGARRIETMFSGSSDNLRQRVSATLGGANGSDNDDQSN
jgi:cell wall-associated NlpC family hydrolase